HPPPPPLHPLSLHDALPISFALFAYIPDKNNIGERLNPGLLQRGRNGQHGHHTGSVIADARTMKFISVLPRIQRRARREDRVQIDRKSTRLNSSHSQISYAV